MTVPACVPFAGSTIHRVTLESFVFRLQLEMPWSIYFASVSTDHPKLRQMRLGQCFGLSPQGRAELYGFAANCYRQTPTLWSHAWALRRDGTIGELHQRLWHEANMSTHPKDRASIRYPKRP